MLKLILNDLASGINSFQIINEVELEIGGQLIEQWRMEEWCELTQIIKKVN